MNTIYEKCGIVSVLIIKSHAGANTSRIVIIAHIISQMKFEYWHTHDTGNSLIEFLDVSEEDFLAYMLNKTDLIITRKEQPNEPKWIPVGEKLPEDCPELHFYDDGRLKFTTVLCADDGCVKMVNRLSVSKCGSAYLDEQATDGWIWGAHKTPTHWMPLPSTEGIRNDT